MKKKELLDYADFIGRLRISAKTGKEARHAVQGFCRDLRKIAKPIINDIEETRLEIIGERQDDVNRWAELEIEAQKPETMAEAKNKMDAMPDVRVIVEDIRAAYNRILEEQVEAPLPVVDPELLLDAIVEADSASATWTLDEYYTLFGMFFKED